MASSAGGAAGGATGSIRAGRAHVEMSAKDVGLSKTLDNLKKRIVGFGKSTAKLGGLLGGGGLAGLGVIGKAFDGFLDRAGELSRLSQKLGVSTEQLSQFAYAAETTGMSLEDMTGQFENLAERVAQGAAGSGEAAETFKKLGIDAAQLKLQNPVEQMITLAKAMEGVTNETERLGMLSSLGGDQFQWMNNLFKKGPDGIRGLMEEAKAVGSSLSGEDAANSVRASQAIQRGWTAVKNTFFAVGSALLPMVERLESVSAAVVTSVGQIRELIKENSGLVIGITAGISAVVALGAGLTSLGLSIALAGMAFGGLVSGITFLVGAIPILLKLAVVAAVATAVVYAVREIAAALGVLEPIMQRFRGTLAGLAEGWDYIRDAIGTGAEGIKAALSMGDVVGAFKIAVATLKVTWKALVIGITAVWDTFKNGFIDGWTEAIAGLELAWNDFAHGVRSLFNQLAVFVSDLFNKIIRGVHHAIGEAARIGGYGLAAAGPAGVIAAFGLKKVAKQLGDAPDVRFADDTQDRIEWDRKAEEMRIQADAMAKINARAIERMKEEDKSQQELDEAKRELDALVNDAKARAAKAAEPVKPAATPPARLRSIVETALGTRGGFSADRIGYTASNELNAIERNTHEAARLMRNMVDKIDGVRAEFA